jgi:hypothetical protein
MLWSYQTETKENDKKTKKNPQMLKRISHIRIDIIHFGFANWLCPSADSFLSARLIFFAAQKGKKRKNEVSGYAVDPSYSKINSKSSSTI